VRGALGDIMRCIKSTTLILSLFFAIGAVFVPFSRAYAFFGCVPTPPVPPLPPPYVLTFDGSAAIQRTFSNTYLSSNFSKECIADALVTFLGKSMIRNFMGSIVDWINNDFEGGPAFVTNPQGFFVNIADEAAGDFIENRLGPLGQLVCSPFDLQLRLNLWLSTSASKKQYIGCRLSEIEKNAYKAFTEGGFIVNGGWNTFHSMTSDPRNNQFGAFLIASDALNTEFIKKANEKLRELSYGRGFLSFNKCTAYKAEKNKSGGHDCAQYKTETPGSLIEGQLNNVFGSDLRQLELADEINEVFQAMVNYGLRQVFSSAGGLRSTGVRVANNRPAVIQDLINSTPETVQTTILSDTATTGLEILRKNAESQDRTSQEMGKSVGNLYDNTSFNQNLAIGRPATQSGERGDKWWYLFTADAAVNGTTDGASDKCSSKYTCSARTRGGQATEYWEVELDKQSFIDHVKIYRANDLSYMDSLGNFSLFVLDSNHNTVFSKSINPTNSSPIPLIIQIGFAGKFVRIERYDEHFLDLAEVEVYGTENTTAQTTTKKSPVTAPPANNTPVVQTQANVETKVDGPVFTINETLTDARIGITTTKSEGGTFKEFAPSQAFSNILIRVKNQTTGEIKLEEVIVNNNTTTYRTIKTFNASIGDRITIGYEITPTNAAEGQKYEVITEITDKTGIQISGAVSTVIIDVSN